MRELENPFVAATTQRLEVSKTLSRDDLRSLLAKRTGSYYDQVDAADFCKRVILKPPLKRFWADKT